jgi:hypothetical protein
VAFAFLFEVLEVFSLLTAGLSYNIFTLLEVHQPQIPYSEILDYLENNWLQLLFYDCEDDLPNTIVIFIYFVVMFLLLCCICNWP